jgi:sortase A
LRIKNIIVGIASTALIGGGLTLVAFFFVSQSLTGNASEDGAGGFDDVAPTIEGTKDKNEAADAPEDETLTVTVPEMSRFQDAAVPTTAGDDEEALKEYAGIHLEGTGFPWEEEANVYIAGHRLGYPGTDSFLAFYDQNRLRKGDEIFVTDSEGTKYTYRVFRSFVTDPTDFSVTEPVEGKNVLTLQTCTLPDYSKRLITQAEMVEKA